MEPESSNGEPEEARASKEEPKEAESIRRPPLSLLRNWISLTGVIIGGFTLANMLALLLAATILGMRPSPYFGIVVYLLFPAIALVGLLLIVVGMLFQRRRLRRLASAAAEAQQAAYLFRHGVMALGAFSLIFAMGTALASYHGYQFTDSATFCGQTCHTPMRPEFTAYQDSPHARVACVGCHVGPGATWFVRSKLSGLYQVYAVTFDKYPKPITTPIKELRPVRSACEQCHWPQKFYGAQLKAFAHYAYDEKNTPTRIELLIKTGGGSAEFGRATGIHWHMNIANEVWYVASDKQAQVIPWVKVKTPDGRTTEYVAKGSTLTPKQIEAMPTEVMDCVTCHTRPSHKFRSPDQAVDEAFEAGQIDPSLPYLKREAVKALITKYGTVEEATEKIATALDSFYHNQYPQVYATKFPQIESAVSTIQQIYQNNIFPDMRVDWTTHQDNIGHMYYPGCFRCHDGQHASADGRVIPDECESCHTVLATPTSVAEFKHPIDLKKLGSLTCSACHTGRVL
ncbi:MAG TPA: NapC/NirT family cytochrome c [Candidatus Binataceae bacterium]|nr:NapC/NirT family cytochrome c [Candidatus Binataceae bacterium]